MNNYFFDALYLFNCGMRGIEPQVSYELNIKEIYIISKKQGIWDIVFLALIKLYNKDKSIFKEEEFSRLNSDFLSHCVMASNKLVFIHKIIKKLEDNGISCAVLKGESVSRFYHTPLSRISSDADILIDKKNTSKCLELLKKEGFLVEEQHKDSHQIQCRHPLSGLIEIHNRMYGVKTQEITFNNEISYDEEYTSFSAFDGFKLKTLGITDNAVFLIMHFLKHFIHEGVGIRQLADTLLYIENNIDEIDFNKLNNILKSLGFDTIYSYMTEIGKRYLGFSNKLKELTPIDDKMLNRIIDDMEKGGIFGLCEDRKGFYNIYLKERYKRFHNGDIETYYNKRKLVRLFPSRNYLSVNYAYVNKTPLLIPVAWGHRIIDNFIKKKQVKDTNSNNDRLEFLRDLKMI